MSLKINLSDKKINYISDTQCIISLKSNLPITEISLLNLILEGHVERTDRFQSGFFCPPVIFL
jgi:hypothetical protein